MKVLQKWIENLSIPVAHAHCDVPCGVYEPDSMLWAAETCVKLCEKLQALELPDSNNKMQVLEFHNTLARAISVKEEYAQICKKEALILWTDYFKMEHFGKWPNLSEMVHKITKQCSLVKRGISLEEAKKLQIMAKELADIFRTTKQ